MRIVLSVEAVKRQLWREDTTHELIYSVCPLRIILSELEGASGLKNYYTVELGVSWLLNTILFLASIADSSKYRRIPIYSEYKLYIKSINIPEPQKNLGFLERKKANIKNFVEKNRSWEKPGVGNTGQFSSSIPIIKSSYAYS